MNYQETLDYLYSRLPMFSKLGASAIKKDLTNTLKICSHLGNPETKFRTIHVGGTNGKGSVSHMLAAILQTAGYKTGLYTSPHLRDFRERIRVNGQMISEDKVIEFVESQKDIIEQIEPSFFEVTVGMAFQHFADEKVDIAVIEVGLGGRLDSTNVINPLLSVITNIGLDHTNILGDTLQKIAIEKAGIIKENTPVIIGERHHETENVFIEVARCKKAPITFAVDEWLAAVDSSYISDGSDTIMIRTNHIFQEHPLRLELDLAGSYQLKNVKTILASVNELKKNGFVIRDNHIKAALKEVKTLTGLLGRWHTLSKDPLIICDTGHNEHGIREVVKNIRAVKYTNLHMVIGMVKDKDIKKVLSLLPQDATYYFCAPSIERAKPPQELMEDAEDFGLKGKAFDSVSEALESAKLNATTDDFIFVGGSTFVVAEVI